MRNVGRTSSARGDEVKDDGVRRKTDVGGFDEEAISFGREDGFSPDLVFKSREVQMPVQACVGSA